MVHMKTEGLDLYNHHHQRMQTGDLVEFRGESIVGGLIRWVTGKPVNHSALVLRMPFEDCVERRFIIEAVESGLEFHLLSSVLRRFSGSAWWSPLKASAHQRERIAAWAMVQLSENNGYDYGSLFRQAVARVSLDGRRYFCSEFVHTALISAEIIPPPVDQKALRPGEFSQLGVFENPALVK